MNKLSALALGTALALVAPLAVNAQDTDLGVELDGGVGVELGGDNEAGANAGVGADVSAGTDFNADTLTHADVDAAIQSSSTVNVDDIDASSDIRIVSISSLSANDGGDASVLTDTRAAFDADISALQSDISANADLAAALEAEGHAAEDVVAIWTHGSGTVVLFVDA